MPRPLKILLRLILWPLAVLLVLALLFAAVFWLANRQDEALMPEAAQALIFTPPTSEAMRRNGYFILLGLGAPASESAQTAGERFFAAQMKDYDRYRQTGEAGNSTAQAWPHRPMAIEALRCPPENEDCPAWWRARAPEVQAALAQHAHVLQRYQSLLDAPEYTEVFPPHMAVAFPYYADLVAASDLTLMQAALWLHEGRMERVDQALELLARNARLHRRLMSGARTLIGGMIAIAMQVRQQRIVSHLLRRHPDLARAQAARWRETLADGPADLSAALQGEGRMKLGTLDASMNTSALEAFARAKGANAPGDDNAEGAVSLERAMFIYRMLYLNHDTLNRAYRDTQRAVRLASVPADQFDAQAAALAKQAQADIGHPWWQRPYFGLRNFMGNILLNIGEPDMRLYIERAHDAEGHRRLVLLQLAAYRDGIVPADMPGWLDKSPEALRNPYTLAPMGWEKAPGGHASKDQGGKADKADNAENTENTENTENAQGRATDHGGEGDAHGRVAGDAAANAANTTASGAGGRLVFQGRQPQPQNPGRAAAYRVRVFTS